MLLAPLNAELESQTKREPLVPIGFGAKGDLLLVIVTTWGRTVLSRVRGASM